MALQESGEMYLETIYVLQRKSGTHNCYKPYEFPEGGCEHYFRQMQATDGQQRLNVLTGLLGLLNAVYKLDLSRTEELSDEAVALPQQIIRYINKNISQPLALEQICRQFYISRSQLCRMFTQVTGTTVWRYITIKRMELAQKLLEAGENPTHIYEQCGYGDYSSFYRAYRKHFGHCPGRKV